MSFSSDTPVRTPLQKVISSDIQDNFTQWQVSAARGFIGRMLLAESEERMNFQVQEQNFTAFGEDLFSDQAFLKKNL